MRPHNSQSEAGLLPLAQSAGENLELVCSRVQRDAEIITANFHSKSGLKGDPFDTSYVPATGDLVWSFYFFSFHLF